MSSGPIWVSLINSTADEGFDFSDSCKTVPPPSTVAYARDELSDRNSAAEGLGAVWLTR